MFKKFQECCNKSELEKLQKLAEERYLKNEISEAYYNQLMAVYKRKMKQFIKNKCDCISVDKINFRYSIVDPDIIKDFLAICDKKGYTFNMLLDVFIENGIKQSREMGVI